MTRFSQFDPGPLAHGLRFPLWGAIGTNYLTPTCAAPTVSRLGENRMKPLSIMSLLMLPFFASVSLAAPVADDVLGTLYGMRTAYRSSYAPADWKKKISGYDL